jgi:hypothetical protein
MYLSLISELNFLGLERLRIELLQVTLCNIINFDALSDETIEIIQLVYTNISVLQLAYPMLKILEFVTDILDINISGIQHDLDRLMIVTDMRRYTSLDNTFLFSRELLKAMIGSNTRTLTDMTKNLTKARKKDFFLNTKTLTQLALNKYGGKSKYLFTTEMIYSDDTKKFIAPFSIINCYDNPIKNKFEYSLNFEESKVIDKFIDFEI